MEKENLEFWKKWKRDRFGLFERCGKLGDLHWVAKKGNYNVKSCLPSLYWVIQSQHCRVCEGNSDFYATGQVNIQV